MNNKVSIVAETPRLILRHFCENDLDDLAVILANPKVMHFSAKGAKTKEETQQLLQKILSSYQTEGYGLYAVIHKDDRQLIGYCGLFVWSIEGQQEVEIGYRLSPDYWGQGLATEAAKAARDRAFDKLKLNNIVSIIQLKNIPSIRVAEKIGMKYERDSIFMGLSVRIYRILKPPQD